VITKGHAIEVRGISVEVVRKDIKNLHVGVYPPNGRVRVAAPLRLDDEAVRLAVISRLGWIRRQRKGFDQQLRQSQREMVRGESHYYQGRRYRLDVIERDGLPSVRILSNRTMELRIRPGADRGAREAVLLRWYRRRLQEQIPQLLAKWEPKVGVDVAEVRIKKMKTRWGTCTSEARRIWLNLELVKKPSSCLEYILVHEMIHLLERHHNERFRDLMDEVMPQWQLHREELNRVPLAHEKWKY
jgi:predicted metal-dependent hydrolase